VAPAITAACDNPATSPFTKVNVGALTIKRRPGRESGTTGGFDFQNSRGIDMAVIASVSEAIHRTAQRKNGLLRRFRSSQ
jgi:hypothetical protein